MVNGETLKAIIQLGSPEVVKLLSLFTLPVVAHVAFKYNKWRFSSTYHVETADQLLSNVTVVSSVEEGRLLSDSLIRNKGEDWFVDVHADESTSTLVDLPVEGVRISNSANLSSQ